MLTSPPIADVAGHLRLVVARTARRLRQEAGADLSPSVISALASIDRHGPLTASGRVGRPARRPRAQAPPADDHAGAHGDPGARALGPDRERGRAGVDGARAD